MNARTPATFLQRPLQGSGRPRQAFSRGELAALLAISMLLLGAGIWLGQVAAHLGWTLADWHSPPDRDTVGRELLAQGKAFEAAQLFTTADWRGIALYRAGRYQRAAEMFALGEDAEAAYNRGNALIRLRSYDDARRAFRLALARDPGHEHAQANLRMLDELDQPRPDSERSEDRNAAQGEPQPDPNGDTAGGQEMRERPPDIEQRSRDDPAADDGDRAEQEADNLTPPQPSSQSGESDRAQERELRHDQALAAPARSNDEAREKRDGDTDARGSEAQDPAATQSEEQALAERIALRRLVDDPAIVLRARLQAAARARQNP